MYCKNCGNFVDSNYCPKCGTPTGNTRSGKCGSATESTDFRDHPGESQQEYFGITPRRGEYPR